MNPSTTTQPPAVQHSAEDAEALAAMFDAEDPPQPPVQREDSQFLPPDAGDNYAIKRTPAFPVTNAHAKFGECLDVVYFIGAFLYDRNCYDLCSYRSAYFYSGPCEVNNSNEATPSQWQQQQRRRRHCRHCALQGAHHSPPHPTRADPWHRALQFLLHR